MISLQKYLSQRLMLLALIISVGLIAIVYNMYEWGLDDSSEFYLLEDAKWAEQIISSEIELPDNNEFRHFYLSINSLPKKYISQLDEALDTHFFFLEDERNSYYGLQYRLDKGSQLFVIHVFPIEANGEGVSLLQVGLMMSAGLIALMLLAALAIHQRIAQSMQSLFRVSNASQFDITSVNDFTEINTIVNALTKLIADLDNKNKQERLFIQTLSHELRTPMATIQVALELLFKKELSEKVTNKLEIIFSSNKQMQSLSHDLLTLWSDTKVENNEIIDIEHSIDLSIAELDQVFSCKNRFDISTLDKTTNSTYVKATNLHLGLLLNNLIKNAIVYSDGKIKVRYDRHHIEIINNKSEHRVDPLVAGSGIGLIIATRSAELIGWKLEIEQTSTEFKVSVLF